MKPEKLGPIQSVFTGTIFSIKHRAVTFADGTMMTYEYCERPSSVSILAVNDRDELLLIREYRHGYGREVWFLPAGRMDKTGDTPKSAAQRELREETGYRAKKLKLLHKKSPSNTLLWDIYTFAATDLVLDPLPKDTHEVITPHFVPVAQAVEMALDGTIEDEFISYNIIRFDYLRRHGQFQW